MAFTNLKRYKLRRGAPEPLKSFVVTFFFPRRKEPGQKLEAQLNELNAMHLTGPQSGSLDSPKAR